MIIGYYKAALIFSFLFLTRMSIICYIRNKMINCYKLNTLKQKIMHYLFILSKRLKWMTQYKACANVDIIVHLPTQPNRLKVSSSFISFYFFLYFSFIFSVFFPSLPRNKLLLYVLILISHRPFSYHLPKKNPFELLPFSPIKASPPYFGFLSIQRFMAHNPKQLFILGFILWVFNLFFIFFFF